MDTITCFIKTCENSIYCRLDYPRSLNKYFLKNTGYVQYDRKIEITGIDESILSVPLLSVISPIAWAVGANISIAFTDYDYLASLEKLRGIYHNFFPGLSCAGRFATDVRVNAAFSENRDAILYSGGVDSLASFLSHKKEKPDLISIWGVQDIPTFETRFWNTMWNGISAIAEHEGVQAYQVKTDLYRNINHELLNHKFGYKQLKNSWWNNFASSLFLTGMCAPITAARGSKKLIMSSSYPPGYQGITAFHSSIVQNIRWSNIPVVQDGFEMSRQQKVAYICENDTHGYLSQLRVCFDSAFKTNCGKCEKCSRTIIALTIEGRDPGKCNFKVDSKTFKNLKKRLDRRAIGLNTGVKSFWLDMQKHIPENILHDFHGSREFLVWLKTYEISKYRTNIFYYKLWMAGVLVANRRIKVRAVWRKVRCYLKYFG